MSASHALVSVIVPTRARDAKLRVVLDGLAAQRWPAERLEVFVVHDGATPEQVPSLSEHPLAPQLRVLFVPQGGPARARNHALELAQGDYVLFLNDDVILAPDLVEAHLNTHQQLGEPAAVLGTFQFTQALRRDFFHRVLEDSGFTHTLQLQPERFYRYGTFWTSNLSVPRGVFAVVGGFHPAFVEPSNDDIELGLRLERELGLRVYFTPRARAEHDHVHDVAMWRRRNRMLGRTTFLLHTLHQNSDLSGLMEQGRLSSARVEQQYEALQAEAQAFSELEELLKLVCSRANAGAASGQVSLDPAQVYVLPAQAEALCAELLRRLGRYDSLCGLLEAARVSLG